MKIMLKGLFADKPVYRKFLIVVSLVLFSTIIFSMVGGLLVSSLYNIDFLGDTTALSDLENPNVIAAMKLLQMLTTGIGMFIIPSFLAAYLFDPSPKKYLGMIGKIPVAVFALTTIIMFAIVPLINLLMVFNAELHLPSFLSVVEQWMKSSEEKAARLTEVFLVMKTPGELYYNLLIIAVLPALGEELLFRGILQRLFNDLTKNIHVAIFITAALFSAIHMQFYGFLPRMVLGVLFGYLFVWSGSIWVPILGHFINNGAAVVFAYLAGNKQMPFNQDTVGTEDGQLPFVLLSIVIVGGLVFYIKKTMQSNDKIEE
jgi:uncharacterized protein